MIQITTVVKSVQFVDYDKNTHGFTINAIENSADGSKVKHVYVDGFLDSLDNQSILKLLFNFKIGCKIFDYFRIAKKIVKTKSNIVVNNQEYCYDDYKTYIQS
jgi:hypothetical protein